MSINRNNNTIQLDISPESKYVEGTASVIFAPGALMLYQADGTYVQHDVISGHAEKLFAVENAYSGGDITTTYQVGDNVQMRLCRPGDLVLAWLTAGVATTVGSFLDSAGDGALTNAAIGAINLVGVAMEDVSASAFAERITIRVY